MMIAFGKPKDGPPALKTPGEPEEPEQIEAHPETAPTGLDAIGEEFGLDPASTRQLARKLMQHFMGQCGGEAEEGETEEHPE
jgi:phage terminase small subunit